MAGTDRWTQLALSPSETLEVELKGWLDLGLNEDKANIAQAILALANHGGGVVLVGYREDGSGWREEGSAPTAAGSFTTDTVNGIVEKFADPSFHCELHVIEHEQLRYPHPLIVVPGAHRVPVRAKRGGPDGKHVQMNAYYIRRPGPQSAPPQTAAEWQQLIHRCVLADRDDLLDNLRAALAGEPSRRSEPTLEERAAKWETDSLQRFEQLLAEKDASATYERGYYTCSYVFSERSDIDARKLLETLRAAERQTGWPVWMVFDGAPLAPYPMDEMIECHVWTPGEHHEAGHSDFWRAAPDGRFFLLRGYQEDEPEVLKGKAEPGTVFDRVLPFWRTGECLLHAARTAERLGLPRTPIHTRMTWTGLSGRRLQDVTGHWREYSGGAVSRQDVVRTQATVDADRIRLQLTDLVMELTRPLLQVFGFATPERAGIEAELARMLQRTGGS